ncbi:MAG: hypothetical protein JWP02_1355, partial [Acidimicrobiales bacterium]|nr:hypothetical protein [Acidimicrobiales bacterium]
MAVLRLFASAREAAGLSVDRIDGATVADVLDEARRRYGEAFAAVLTHSRVWVNGQPADVRAAVRPGDVVAVLPPVSGGSDTGVVDPPVRPRGHTAPPAPTAADRAPREPLTEPLPFTKPGGTRSAAGWFRPPDITAADVEGSLARSTAPSPASAPAAQPSPGPDRDRDSDRDRPRRA